MKLLIATKNKGKIEGAKRAFSKFFNDIIIEGVSVASEVREQPVNEETCLGAKNRVKNLRLYAKENKINADFYLAIEAGLVNQMGSWMITSVALIEDNQGYQSFGMSPAYPVPDKLVDDIISTDLSQVMNNIFSKDEERHNSGGGIQLLTHNNISRIDLTEMAFVMALTKFVNGGSWK